VESAHSGEISFQSFALSGFKSLNQLIQCLFGELLGLLNLHYLVPPCGFLWSFIQDLRTTKTAWEAERRTEESRAEQSAFELDSRCLLASRMLASPVREAGIPKLGAERNEQAQSTGKMDKKVETWKEVLADSARGNV
jgi:hypothetical protein